MNGNKTIIIIADPHLESQANDVMCMIEFIRTLKPAEHILIFLGDLFHIWVETTRYHTEQEKQLLNELSSFRSQGGIIYLIVGNRDLFFREISSSDDSCLPFNAICLGFMKLNFHQGLLMAHHGDTVNRKNKQYLIWRRIVRSSLAKYIFYKIPTEKGRTILWGSEKRIRDTNKEFRESFPDDQWAKFIEKVHQLHSPKLLLVGHFHPKSPIITKHNDTTGIVIPAWQRSQIYLEVDCQLNYQFRSYSPSNAQ